MNNFVAVEIRIRDDKDSPGRLASIMMVHKEDVDKLLHSDWDHEGLLHTFWFNKRISGRFRNELSLEDQIATSKEWYPENF